MLAQIADSEANPGKRSPGWRTRVGNALRWKARVRKAVNVRATALKAEQSPGRQHQRRKAMLQVIAEEVGEEEFARFAALTEARHPHLFQGGEHG